MKSISYSILLLLFLLSGISAHAQTSNPEKELTELLNRFLKGASENDAAMHDRFWAEDLIYTSSSGERFGKDAIMSGFESNEPEKSDSPSVKYSADNVRIKLFGDVAVVAFRLVAESEQSHGSETTYYLNSGTFVKRDGQWKAVNWQATKVPEN